MVGGAGAASARRLALRPFAFGAVADGHAKLRVEVLLRHALNVAGRDGLQFGKFGVGLGGVAVDAKRIAQCKAAPVDGLAFPKLAGHQLVLGFVQLGLGGGRVAQALHLRQKCGFALGDGVPGGQDRADHEAAWLGRQVGVGIDLRGDLLVVDQAVVEPRRLAGRQDRIQHLQRRRVRVRGLRTQPGDRHRRQRDVRAVAVIDAGPLARRLDRGHPLDGLGRVLQRGQVLGDPGVELGLVEVADHDQGGVVGAVVGLVEGADVIDGGRIQLLDRADARPMVGVGLVGGLRDVERKQPPVGRGQHALAQLLLHDVALGFEIRLVDDQRAHPLGLGPDEPLQMVGRHHLVVVGEVVPGGGVVEPADVLGEPVETLRRQVLGRLEHQVLEEVGEARAPGRIILGAHPVPDLHGHVGRGPVERCVDLQPIGQRALPVDDRWHRALGGGAALAGPVRWRPR